MTLSTFYYPVAEGARREMSRSLDEQEAQLILVSRTMLSRVLNALDEADVRIADLLQRRAPARRCPRMTYRIARVAIVWFCMPATTAILSLTVAGISS